jgi:hypothetical protein
MESHRVTWFDTDFASTIVNDADARAAISALAPDVLRSAPSGPNSPPQYVERERFHTLGRWCTALPEARSVS